MKVPFKSRFSLKKLIDFWEKRAAESPDGCEREFASSLIKRVKSVPELNGIITDYSVLRENKVLMDGLVSAIFPTAYLNSNLQAITPPMDFSSVYCTDRFRDLFCRDNGDFEFDFNIDNDSLDRRKIMASYSGILYRYYNVNIQINFPLIRRITDKETGLNRYFKINLDNRFIDAKLNGIIPILTKDQIAGLAENIMDLDLWYNTIPPEIFELEGLLVVNSFEVTEQESISAIKQDLLKKNVLSSDGGFAEIQNKIRTMFRNPRLKLGLIAIQDDRKRLLNSGHEIGNSFLMNESCINCCNDYKGSIYERAMESDEPQIICDLDSFDKCSSVDNAIAKQGLKNILVASLKADGKVIGLLELASPVPGDFNAFNSIKIKDVLPLFSLAMKRSLEDIENKIQAIIKEKCTAVHPSVEWRFRDAALHLIEKEKEDDYAEMEEIIFKDVYPIYALSDIRNSSVIRNNAIQADLKHNLLLARRIIEEAYKVKEMPVLELLNYRLEERILTLDSGLHSGDETSIISFLKREVESLFPKLEGYGKKVTDAVSKYKNALDPELGFYYDKRKDYEESVAELNDVVASYVDEEEEKAQVYFPHYFEKYKTDGIEYTIYIGDSISENGGFDEMYLKNIRLWQIMMMCNAARKAEQLKSKLRIKLELAHLILVQNTPLSIRFHHDQKKFDVDGTYNVHYEILKKRIDKAELKGKEERLTQPGMLAIVYTQPSEANEYRQYISFLQARGYLEDNIEELELKDLQGIYGLRALRVPINLLPVKLQQEMNISNLLKQIESTEK